MNARIDDLALAGQELDPCPLDHPLAGRLRYSEWLLFAGVHDLMHTDQLERLAASLLLGVGVFRS
jgi:hypothetical protein